MIIPVTKPFLPPQEDYSRYVKEIWQREWLTNNGPLVNDLELKLKEYLNLDHLLFVSNGTLALQLAIKALNLSGEVITTPFSYVATTSSIVWEQCVPRFVDIDPHTFNIDAGRIEDAITSNTSAILATHVFGNPCDITTIEDIALRHKLKVIYDAAHCFGTQFNGRSVYAYGDISTASFHATKLFHSTEGGAVITSDSQLLRKMSLLRNFGHTSAVDFDGVGINAKNSEFHAAMGLCVLKYMDSILATRKTQWLLYRDLLKNLKVDFLTICPGDVVYNYSYFPIVFSSENQLMESYNALQLQNVICRRYFYPSLNTLNYVEKTDCPISERISARVLCLPLYNDLAYEEQEMIARILLRIQNN